jgi:predicted transposase YdaD
VEFNPFDVATKEHVWEDPAAWLARLGVYPSGPVEVIDSDITTLTASAEKVIRIWEDDPELYLNARVELVPLAPLAAVSESDLPGVLQRVKHRINQEPPPRAAVLFTATYLLLGLRLADEEAKHLFEGAQIMHQSSTYEAILKEGRQEGLLEGLEVGRTGEARRFLRRLGTNKFGEPDQAIAAKLDTIQDIEFLEALGVRILQPDLSSWEDLLTGS